MAENKNNIRSNTKNNLSTNYIMEKKNNNKKEVDELINRLIDELEKYNYPSEYKEELNKQAEKIRNYKIKNNNNKTSSSGWLNIAIDNTKKLLKSKPKQPKNYYNYDKKFIKKINRDVDLGLRHGVASENIKHVPLRQTKKYIRKDNKENIKKLLNKLIQEKIF